MTEMDKARITEKVMKLSPKMGDILHVTVGTDDIGDGKPWIPDHETLYEVARQWEGVAPEGVTVLVTHWLQKVEIEPLWEDEHAAR